MLDGDLFNDVDNTETQERSSFGLRGNPTIRTISPSLNNATYTSTPAHHHHNYHHHSAQSNTNQQSANPKTQQSKKIPKFRCIYKKELTSILAPSEAFSAFASGPLFCSVGTTFGRVHIVTLDGDFVQTFPSANRTGVITQITLKEELVIFANSIGEIICWDWRFVRHLDMSPVSPSPIHSLAVSTDFCWTSGSIYYSREQGIVHRRTRNSVSRLTDSVVFEDCHTMAEFDRLFHGLPSHIHADYHQEVQLQQQLIQSMVCDTNHVFFCWKDHVYAYNERRDRVTARFGEFPQYDFESQDVRRRSTLGLVLGGEWLIVHSGKLVLLCLRRNFREHPFSVVHQFSFEAQVQKVSLIAQNILVCLDKSATTSDLDDSFASNVDLNSNDNPSQRSHQAPGNPKTNTNPKTKMKTKTKTRTRTRINPNNKHTQPVYRGTETETGTGTGTETEMDVQTETETETETESETETEKTYNNNNNNNNNTNNNNNNNTNNNNNNNTNNNNTTTNNNNNNNNTYKTTMTATGNNNNTTNNYTNNNTDVDAQSSSTSDLNTTTNTTTTNNNDITITATTSDTDTDGAAAAARARVNVIATQAQILTETLEVTASFDLPPSVGRTISAQFSQAQSMSMSMIGNTPHNATHCHLLFPRALFVLRVLKASEQVWWLVKSQRYPLVMHLCQQKYPREQVFMEVAGMHANALWHEGRHVEAVRVWGEVHLPSAPAVYWKYFVDRLDAAGKLDLSIKWLPFNDRTKVGHEIYERLLISKIADGDYLTLLARVARWPILYKIAPVMAAIFAALYRHISRILSTNPSESDHHRATSADQHSNLRHQNTEGGVPQQTGKGKVVFDDMTSMYILFLALFKLYEFSNKFLEAAQVLTQMDLLRKDGVSCTFEGTSWQGDDESYTHALESALSVANKTRAPTYFEAKQLWGVLAPNRERENAQLPTPTPTPAATSTILTSTSFQNSTPTTTTANNPTTTTTTTTTNNNTNSSTNSNTNNRSSSSSSSNNNSSSKSSSSNNTNHSNNSNTKTMSNNSKLSINTQANITTTGTHSTQNEGKGLQVLRMLWLSPGKASTSSRDAQHASRSTTSSSSSSSRSWRQSRPSSKKQLLQPPPTQHSNIVLGYVELLSNFEARRALLLALFALDREFTLNALGQQWQTVSSKEVAAMLDGAVDADGLLTFLEICVKHKLPISDRHRDILVAVSLL